MKNIRNVIIAVLLLIFLLAVPFWGNIKSALGIGGADSESGATPETAGYIVDKTKENQSLSSKNT